MDSPDPFLSHNPVIRHRQAIVLCVTCNHENKADFRFCNYCGLPSSATTISQREHSERLLGTTATLELPEKLIDLRLENIFTSHSKVTGKASARRQPVMAAFEIFLHSYGKTIVTASPQDVIKYMAYKDVSGVGRTVVHDTNCFNIGHSSRLPSCDPNICMTVMAAESQRTAVVVPLKEGYRQLGLDSKWDNTSGTGNPADSNIVLQQLLKIKLQQLRAEVEQRQPAVLLRFHIKKLLHGMRALLFRPEFQTPYQQFEVKKYMALFSLAAETSRRGDDISLLLITRVLRLPVLGGLIFNFVFGKVIRSNVSEPFGLTYNKEDPWQCAILLLDEYILQAYRMNIDTSSGYLFFNVTLQLEKTPGKISSHEMTTNLKKFISLTNIDLQQGGLPVSMQSFRSGGAISKFLEGDSMEQVMGEAMWKNPKTAWRYMKILRVLGPFKKSTSLFTPEDYHLINRIPLKLQAKWLQAFNCDTLETELMLQATEA